MKRRNQLVAIVLVAAMALGLNGCRYSDTIEQIIYNQFLSGLIDYEPPFDVKDNDEDNEEEDEEIPELEADEDADREQEEQTAGILSDYATSGEGYKVVYNEDAESGAEVDVEVEGSGDAAEELTENDDTNEEEEEDNIGTEATTLSEEEDAADAPDDTGDESSGGSEGGEDGEENEETGEAETTKDKTYKKIVDSSGSKTSVPEEVDTVATVGEAAIMISILRAGESVVATDAVTLNLAKASDAGSSVIGDLSGASSLWSGDGSDGITSANLTKLIDLAPDIVIEFSGSTALTDSQVEKLENAGIDYLALPDVDSVSDLTECMNLLGQLFEDTDYEAASDWASDYISFVEDDLLKTVKSASGSSGFYTLYVDDWDSSAKCTLSSSTSGTVTVKGGTAVVKNKMYAEKQYWCDLLDYAGVSDTVDTYDSYSKSTKYFCPLYPRTSSLSISGGSLATSTFGKGASFLSADGAGLGTAKFPCVIAADEDTAAGIEDSRDATADSDETGAARGQWSVYSAVSNQQGTFSGSNAFYDAGGNLVTTQIDGDYDVLVNPSGFDSWAEGTCESVLEAAWVAWKITGKFDKSDVTSYVKEFYSTFYDYDLSTDQLNYILNLD